MITSYFQQKNCNESLFILETCVYFNTEIYRVLQKLVREQNEIRKKIKYRSMIQIDSRFVDKHLV